MANLRKKIKGDSGMKRVKDIFTEIAKVREGNRNNLKTSEEGTWSKEIGGISSHPSLKKRLKRLQAMGTAMTGEKLQQKGKQVFQNSLAILLLSPFILLIFWLLLCAIGLSFILASGFSIFFAGLAMRLLYALLL